VPGGASTSKSRSLPSLSVPWSVDPKTRAFFTLERESNSISAAYLDSKTCDGFIAGKVKTHIHPILDRLRHETSGANICQMNNTSTSKFLSLILRHKPEEIGLTLDPNGWASIEELIALAAARGTQLSRAQIETIVAESDKQRFAISADGTKIRANQGHSVGIALGLAPQTPPEQLFHGTATRFLDSIRASGLHSASRQHVHLSSDLSTAEKVGSRHGKPVILTVESGQMARDGHLFYLSENGVWLTDAVPAKYLKA